jgi:hypothetical protein
MALLLTVLLLVIAPALELADETGGIRLLRGVSHHHEPARMTGIQGS